MSNINPMAVEAIHGFAQHSRGLALMQVSYATLGSHVALASMTQIRQEFLAATSEPKLHSQQPILAIQMPRTLSLRQTFS